MKRIFASLASWFVLSAILALPAMAMSISPSKFKIIADPGTEQKISLEVFNNEKAPLAIAVGVLGAEQDSAGRAKFGKDFDVAENWFSFSPSQFILKPSEKKKVDFTISAPADAKPGLAHYIGLAVNARPFAGGANITSRLIAPVTVQISGLIKESLDIENLRTRAWVASGTVLNKSNIELSLSGEAEIKNWSGKILYTQPLVLGNNLLAQTSRQIEAELNFKPRWPGFYPVVLKIRYGQTGQTASAQSIVWYFPYAIYYLAGLIFLAVIVLLAKSKVQRPIV